MVVDDDNNNNERSLELFLKIGLDEQTAKNTVSNDIITTTLTEVILEAGVIEGCSKAIGNLLYSVATKFPAHALVHRSTLLEYIVSSKIKNTAQLDAAILFLGEIGEENLQLNEFEEACGVPAMDNENDCNWVFNENLDEIGGSGDDVDLNSIDITLDGFDGEDGYGLYGFFNEGGYQVEGVGADNMFYVQPQPLAEGVDLTVDGFDGNGLDGVEGVGGVDEVVLPVGEEEVGGVDEVVLPVGEEEVGGVEAAGGGGAQIPLETIDDLIYHLETARNPLQRDFMDSSIYYRLSKSVELLRIKELDPKKMEGRVISAYPRPEYEHNTNLKDGIAYVKGLQIPIHHKVNNEKFISTSRFTPVVEGEDLFLERRVYNVRSSPYVIVHYRYRPRGEAPAKLLHRSALPPIPPATTLEELVVEVRNQSQTIVNLEAAIKTLKESVDTLTEKMQR